MSVALEPEVPALGFQGHACQDPFGSMACTPNLCTSSPPRCAAPAICRLPASTAPHVTRATVIWTPGLASGAVSGLNDPVLHSGQGGADANSLWNIVDNNGSKHRD